ncbi:MAG: 3-dehydroquinate synthase, partial [Paludibacteraceae bacterium]|nr:3-dehydroquinate synthase [Paludibacteraceae bacterium]
GHTFGHALEELSHAQGSPLDHGFAVLYGLIAELYLSVTKTGCPKEPLQQLTQVMLHYYGKPQCKCSDRDKLIALMQQDKKNEHATDINCTLLRAVGEPLINQLITPQEAAEALDYLFSL